MHCTKCVPKDKRNEDQQEGKGKGGEVKTLLVEDTLVPWRIDGRGAFRTDEGGAELCGAPAPRKVLVFFFLLVPNKSVSVCIV